MADLPEPPMPPGEPEATKEQAPTVPWQIPGSGLPIVPPQGDVTTGQRLRSGPEQAAIPGQRTAQASYEVPSGSPFDRYLANLGPAAPAPPSAADLIQHYLTKSKGDPTMALINVMQDRQNNPTDLALRNTEHALFSAHVMKQLGPGLGTAVVGASVPAYSAAKAVGQPFGAFRGATPPSLQEVQYGLWPLLRQLGLMR